MKHAPDQPAPLRRPSRPGFSLIELTVVVIVLGVITVVAIPRITKGSDRSGARALRANFMLLNKALEFYAADHGGQYPTEDDVEAQLTLYSNFAGDRFSLKFDEGGGTIYGPYVLKIPAVTFGPHTGETGIGPTDEPGIGWLYFADEPLIVPNLNDDGGELDLDLLDDLGWGDDFYEERVGGRTLDLPDK